MSDWHPKPGDEVQYGRGVVCRGTYTVADKPAVALQDATGARFLAYVSDLTPAPPATERIPWHQALAIGADVVGFGCIDSAWRTAAGGVRLRNPSGGHLHVEADGTVEVLTEETDR